MKTQDTFGASLICAWAGLGISLATSLATGSDLFTDVVSYSNSSTTIGDFAINDLGDVVWTARDADAGFASLVGIRSFDDGSTRSFLTSDASLGLPFIELGGGVAINDSGAVTFVGRLSTTSVDRQLLLLENDALTGLFNADSSSTFGSSTDRFITDTSIDDDGTVRFAHTVRQNRGSNNNAFVSIIEADGGATTYATQGLQGFAGNPGSQIPNSLFTPNGEMLILYTRSFGSPFSFTIETTLTAVDEDGAAIVGESDSSDFSDNPLTSITHADLNSVGDVAVVGSLRDSPGLAVSVLLATGQIDVRLDTSGAYANFSTVAITDEKHIAVLATLDGGAGTEIVLIDRGNRVTTLLAVGDDLFGSTVTALSFEADHLSSEGWLAFEYELSDGRFGIASAFVPTPGTVGSLACVAGVLAVRRRRTSR